MVSSRSIRLPGQAHNRRQHRRAMHFFAILLRVHIRHANLQRSPRPHDPCPRCQFLPIRWRQQIQFVFHRQHRAVCRHQRVRRVPARAVSDGPRHARMKVIVLLRQLRAKRHANRRLPRRQLDKLCAQMLHQPLASKALSHPSRKLRIFRLKSRLFFHSAAVYQPPHLPLSWPRKPT